MNQTIALLGQLRVIPVAVIDDQSCAAPLGAALKSGGLPCVEVTLRTATALESLAEIAADPEICVGAGTVLRPSQVDEALTAGARYIVTPGFNAEVMRICNLRGVPVFPGVATATEIQLALDAGADIVKFFPAEQAGGIRTLAALAAPFTEARFIPTGGITPITAAGYLAHPSVFAIGGSWIVSTDLLRTADFNRIRTLAASAIDIVEASPTTAVIV